MTENPVMKYIRIDVRQMLRCLQTQQQLNPDVVKGLMYSADLPGALDFVLRLASSEVSALTGQAVRLSWRQQYDPVSNPLTENGGLVVSVAPQVRCAPVRGWRAWVLRVIGVPQAPAPQEWL